MPFDQNQRVMAALLGVALLAGAAAFFLFGRDEEQPKTLPVPVAEEEAPQLPPPTPPESPPAAAPAPPAVAPPKTAAASPAAPATAGAVSEMLVLARRIESSDPKRSRQLLTDVLATDPSNVTALERLSKKMLSDENARQAQELVDRCLSVDQRNAECSALKAGLAEPTQSSVAQAEACLQNNNDAIDCNYTMADSALYDGKKEAATLIAMRMHKANPDAPATKLALGRVKAANGNYGEALPLFKAACDLGDKNGCFRANLLRQEGF
jgi:hypothetical protein